MNDVAWSACGCWSPVLAGACCGYLVCTALAPVVCLCRVLLFADSSRSVCLVVLCFFRPHMFRCCWGFVVDRALTFRFVWGVWWIAPSYVLVCLGVWWSARSYVSVGLGVFGGLSRHKIRCV